MVTVRLHQIDSFTDRQFGGNPTAVVEEGRLLNDAQMKQIAREMNLSESTFILPSNEADFRLRFFTPPGDEITFCGHATVGALKVICREQLMGCRYGEQNTLSLQTNAGLLQVDVEAVNKDQCRLSFDVPKIDMVTAPYDLNDVLQALGVPKAIVNCDTPLMLERTNNYVFFQVNTLKELGSFELDVRGAIDFAQKDRIIVFCALTMESFDDNNHVHSRGFAPLVGVPEDPFTGSMQGGIVGYLVDNDLIDNSMNMIGSEQGHFIDRPGQVYVEINRFPSLSARLHADAVHVFTTELSL